MQGEERHDAREQSYPLTFLSFTSSDIEGFCLREWISISTWSKILGTSTVASLDNDKVNKSTNVEECLTKDLISDSSDRMLYVLWVVFYVSHHPTTSKTGM